MATQSGAKPQLDICLGNINPGKLSTGFVRSLSEAEMDKAISRKMLLVNGPYLDVGRNLVVAEFHQNLTEDYLLFVDSDIEFKPSHIRTLHSYARPDRVVSGVYMSPFPKIGVRPVAGRWGYDDVQKKDSIVTIESSALDDVADGLVKVDGVGAGFMMFHRELVNEMLDKYKPPMPWFLCQVLGETAQWYGEDYMFCMRAAALGVQTYLVPEVRVLHHKEVVL